MTDADNTPDMAAVIRELETARQQIAALTGERDRATQELEQHRARAETMRSALSGHVVRARLGGRALRADDMARLLPALEIGDDGNPTAASAEAFDGYVTANATWLFGETTPSGSAPTAPQTPAPQAPQTPPVNPAPVVADLEKQAREILALRVSDPPEWQRRKAEYVALCNKITTSRR
jgi:hypothetical protein